MSKTVIELLEHLQRILTDSSVVLQEEIATVKPRIAVKSDIAYWNAGEAMVKLSFVEEVLKNTIQEISVGREIRAHALLPLTRERPGTPIYTVGQLRKALADPEIPDDRMLATQTVGTVSGAWNMHASFMGKIPHSNMACITLDHPEMQHLPMEKDRWTRDD